MKYFAKINVCWEPTIRSYYLLALSTFARVRHRIFAKNLTHWPANFFVVDIFARHMAHLKGYTGTH